jgi:hypothetical protein
VPVRRRPGKADWTTGFLVHPRLAAHWCGAHRRLHGGGTEGSLGPALGVGRGGKRRRYAQASFRLGPDLPVKVGGPLASARRFGRGEVLVRVTQRQLAGSYVVPRRHLPRPPNRRSMGTCHPKRSGSAR